VPSDILKAVDSGDVAGLVLLDLSAAFDTVEHDILLRRLNTSYGTNGTAIQLFCSYLTGRSQYVRRGSVKSSIVRLVCGVPQGSVLGLVLFVLFTADLIRLIERHSFIRISMRMILTPTVPAHRLMSVNSSHVYHRALMTLPAGCSPID
jgi:hypothetical protein